MSRPSLNRHGRVSRHLYEVGVAKAAFKGSKVATTCFGHKFNQVVIPPYTLTHTVGDLNDAARTFAVVPAGASDLQAVRTRQLALIRGCKAHEN